MNVKFYIYIFFLFVFIGNRKEKAFSLFFALWCEGEKFLQCPIRVVGEMAEGSKVRLVRCPKCENLLPELPDYPVYQCGGCGAVLRGKLSFPVLSFSYWACLVA